MTDADRIRLTFTDRHGSGESAKDGSQPAGVPPGSRYGGFNLGLYVGDDADAVAARRRELGPRVVFMNQVHGRRVVVVDRDPQTPFEATDGLVTRRPGLALAVLVADCLPVLLFEPEVEVVGCVHAGRRGIQRGVLDATLEAIESCGGRADRVLAWIGPSIGPCCYEVPAAMRDDVAAQIPEAAARTSWGTPALDLRAAAAAQLRRAGVPRISVSGVCTAESADHYSYRRDGLTGRFAGVIELLPEGVS